MATNQNRLARLLASALLSFAILATAGLALAAGLPVDRFERNIEKALLSERLHHTDEARAFWAKVRDDGEILLAKNSESTQYLLGTGRAEYGLGEYRESITLYERMLRVHARQGVNTVDRYPWTYVYLGLAYAHIGDKDKALENWRTVPRRIGPVYAVVHKEVARLEATPGTGGY